MCGWIPGSQATIGVIICVLIAWSLLLWSPQVFIIVIFCFKSSLFFSKFTYFHVQTLILILTQDSQLAHVSSGTDGPFFWGTFLSINSRSSSQPSQSGLKYILSIPLDRAKLKDGQFKRKNISGKRKICIWYEKKNYKKISLPSMDHWKWTFPTLYGISLPRQS